MREKMEIIQRIVQTDSSVLLMGEPGVGKELVAEQIHLLSGHPMDSFIRINCADKKLDKIVYPQDGTLFLDEISFLPLRFQEELLTVIQARKAHFRIIASTKEDMEKSVADGIVLSELYHRLNVLPLLIPPLRQRMEDIFPLALYFLEIYILETKHIFEGFTLEAIAALNRACWTGNIRELKNCIERACIFAQGHLIDEADLFMQRSSSYTEKAQYKHCDLKQALDVFKTSFVRTILEENNGNRTLTAKILGIQRTYLSRLIKDLKITMHKKP